MSHLPMSHAHPAYANHLHGTWQFHRVPNQAPGTGPIQGGVAPPPLTFGAILGEIHVGESRRAAYLAGYLLYRPLGANLAWTALVANPTPPPAQIEGMFYDGLPDPERVYIAQISGTPPNHTFLNGAKGILFVATMELWWEWTPGDARIYTKVS